MAVGGFAPGAAALLAAAALAVHVPVRVLFGFVWYGHCIADLGLCVVCVGGIDVAGVKLAEGGIDKAGVKLAEGGIDAAGVNLLRVGRWD